MPQPDRKTPQLVMMRKLDDLPEVELPEGYELRSFQPGDERTWERIIAEAFDRDVPRGQFGTRIADREAFRPERVLFMCHNGEPVATASAWHVEKYGPETGYVHMVGALPGHQGKGLGYQVSLAALHRMAEERLRRAALQTDDFRLAAVKTYLKLGFEPVLVDENQRQRWAEVLRALGLPDAGRRFQQILTGPVMEYPE
jgi:mycothiol synthase